MLYLVQGTVTTTRYMVDRSEIEMQHLRLVDASTPEKAEEAFRKYFEDMTSEYSIYYRVNSVTCFETIQGE